MTDSNIKIPLINPDEKEDSFKKINNPLQHANLFRRLLFLWVHPILKVNYKIDLNVFY